MLMEKCYDCYAENGLASVGIRKLAESCGCSSAVLYIYFRDLDDLIVQSTAYWRRWRTTSWPRPPPIRRI